MKSVNNRLLGSTTPRVHSKLLRGKSLGPEVEDLAKAVGLPLLPWQSWLLKDAMTIDAQNKWVRKQVLALASRQNGKTHLSRMRIIWGLFLGNERNIIGMSQNRNMALDTFKQVALVVDGCDFLRREVKTIRYANGQETLELKNGNKYEIIAATREAPRGKSADFLYIDELREISPEAMAAARPTITARPNSTIWMTSNAGAKDSEVLNDLRARALTSTRKSLGLYEWSALPNSKLDDRSAWQAANPALGYLIDEETLADAIATEKPDDVRTERLTLWIDALASPWPSGAWEECQDLTLKLSPGPNTYLAIDVSPDRRLATLVGGQQLSDGRIGVGIIQAWQSDTSVDDVIIANEVAGWARKYRAKLTAYDRYAAASIASRLAGAGLTVSDVSGTLFHQASDELLGAMTHKRLVHNGETMLNAHVLSCASKPAGDGNWRLVRRQSAGAVCGAMALAMVVHHASKPTSTPKIVVA
jgi:phage terminase large subunit-like protein